MMMQDIATAIIPVAEVNLRERNVRRETDDALIKRTRADTNIGLKQTHDYAYALEETNLLMIRYRA